MEDQCADTQLNERFKQLHFPHKAHTGAYELATLQVQVYNKKI